MLTKSPQIIFRSYQALSKAHAHTYHQIVMPNQGQLALRIGCIENVVADRGFALIAAGQQHEFSAQENNRFLVADIPQNMLPNANQYPEFSLLNEHIESFLTFIHGYVESRQSNIDATRGNAAIQPMIIELLLSLIVEKFEPINLCDKRMVKVKHYMDTQYSQPLSMLELARIGHVSVRHLNALFRSAFSITPKQYLIAKRMEKAKSLLLSTSLHISVIAERVGYMSLSAFSERFNIYFGRSPSHFRRNEKI